MIKKNGYAMKIVVVGDIYVSTDFFVEEISRLPFGQGTKIASFTWGISSKEEFQQVTRRIEKGGSEAIECPRNIIDEMINADVIFTHFFPIQDEVIKRNKRLKMIATCRGGLEHISNLAENTGIKIINTFRNAEPVADFTLGLMLSEIRNIARSHEAIMNHKWRKTFSNTSLTGNLCDYSIGLVGFGNIGQRVAKKLCALGTRVMAYDKHLSEDQIKQIEPQVDCVTFEQILTDSDIISLHVRYDESLGPIINKHALSIMKPTSVLINTSRAYLVDYNELYKSLLSNQISGAALDVFPDEPLFENWEKYLLLDNVTLTSHLAGDTVNAISKSPKLLVNRLLETKEIENLQ